MMKIDDALLNATVSAVYSGVLFASLPAEAMKSK